MLTNASKHKRNKLVVFKKYVNVIKTSFELFYFFILLLLLLFGPSRLLGSGFHLIQGPIYLG